jgi:uncharacterized protein (DUF736 family)
MSNHQTENRGAIFRNEKKQTESHPDYTGSINVNGVDMWVSGWLKTSEKTGKKFMSLSVKDKVEKAPQMPVKQAAKPSPSGFDDFPDDVPF